MAVRVELNRALSLHREGRWEEAETLYAGVLQADPDNATACHFLGVLISQRGDAEKALRWIDRSLCMTPADDSFWANRGNVNCGIGRYEASVADCSRALALQSNVAETRFNLANA